jgi:hypothetical protein
MPVKKTLKSEKCSCEDKLASCCEDKKSSNCSSNSSAGAVYGIGVIGAIVYFFQNSSGLSDYLVGILKALIWPGMLVYKALELLSL